ncbi:hypothetical protein FHS03_004865 [Massilia violacea]|uniref:Uncharacterized protein n=1 Tax=Pseudoduganella violacea TaxID=1715466 RepID=A0A7W5BF14_9BURK|nr:hypothetical protein [Pseudoduganella violacea]
MRYTCIHKCNYILIHNPLNCAKWITSHIMLDRYYLQSRMTAIAWNE